MRLHTEGLACAAALIGAVFRRPQRVRGRSRLGGRARSRVNRLEGWADDGHKESGESREGASYSPTPRCSRRSLCSNSILGDGHVYVHVHVHVCIRLRVKRIMGTKRAARAERWASYSPPPRCSRRSLCSNILEGYGYVHGYVHVHVHV